MPLARLRSELEFMPSPVEDRPGVLVRDPFGYSDAVLIIPRELVQLLQLFDGETSSLDARHQLVQASGDVRAGEVLDQMEKALGQAGFLLDEQFAALRDDRHREFAAAPLRSPAHVGPGGYPESEGELRSMFDEYFQSARASVADRTIAIAAPHASPPAAWESYAAAFASIPASAREKTFVILGTSHYGPTEKFGLTRKPYSTPYGTTRTDLALIDDLASRAHDGVVMEDYSHAIEHSIEFQTVFLQHRFGADVRIAPILCGAFAKSIYEGGLPEDDEGVKRFLGELAEIAARRTDLFWILGIDMAHMGGRYGDPYAFQSGTPMSEEVERLDRERIAALESGDRTGFWERVKENHDELKWCGSSPLYTFQSVVPGARAETLKYQTWDIDPQSIVTFAAMRFEYRSSLIL